MKFKQFLLTEKYINDYCSFCGHCRQNLEAVDIVINSKHIYNIGQLVQCPCKKSRIWTNSIRNEDRLIAFYEGKEQRYTNGFCNDKFCGYCFATLYPLENGAKMPGKAKRYDRYGCVNCKENQNIFIDGFEEWKEGESKYLLEWYQEWIFKIKKLSQIQG